MQHDESPILNFKKPLNQSAAALSGSSQRIGLKQNPLLTALAIASEVPYIKFNSTYNSFDLRWFILVFRQLIFA